MFTENLNKKIESEIIEIKKAINNIHPIKSIQRGTVAASTSITITINRIDSKKSIVLLNCRGDFSTGGTSSRVVKPGSYLNDLTDVELKLYADSSYTGTVSWQVIEFY